MPHGEESSQHTGWISTYGEQAQQCSKRGFPMQTPGQIQPKEDMTQGIFSRMARAGTPSVWWESQAVGTAVLVLN